MAVSPFLPGCWVGIGYSGRLLPFHVGMGVGSVSVEEGVLFGMVFGIVGVGSLYAALVHFVIAIALVGV